MKTFQFFVVSYVSCINIFILRIWEMFEYVFFLTIILFCLDICQEVIKNWKKKLSEGATFSCNISLRINRRYVKNGNFECILCNLLRVNRWSKVQGTYNSERLFLCVIRYKEHRDLKNKLLKIWCLPALMYQFIRWIRNQQVE